MTNSQQGEHLFDQACELTGDQWKRFWQLVLIDDRSPVKKTLLTICEMFDKAKPQIVRSWKEVSQDVGEINLLTIPNMPGGIGGIGAFSSEELSRDLNLIGMGMHKGKVERDEERNPKPRKTERNYIIHYLITEKNFSWQDTRRYVLEQYPDMLKGKSLSKDIKAMQEMYYPWSKEAAKLTEYAEWRKTFKPL